MSSDDSYEFDFGPSKFLPNKRYIITRYSKTNQVLVSLVSDEIYLIDKVIESALKKLNYYMPLVIETDENGKPKKIYKAKLDLNDEVKMNELRRKWVEDE
jgi:hypothetical protein